jgi:hypothetical protein
MMRYWLMSTLFVLASFAGAEEAPEQWDEWDDLPEDVLDLGGANSARQLSERLDALTQQNPDSAEIDRLLELWLEQSSAAAGPGNRQAVPLQSLMKGPPAGQPGNSGAASESQRQPLQQLLQGPPANPGTSAGGGPPDDLPLGPNNPNRPDVPKP